MDFQDIIAEALDTMTDLSAVEVIYTRGSSWTRLKASPAKTVFKGEQDSKTGVFKQIRSRDYLIATCDLKFNDEQITPQRGDTITEVIDGTTYVYSVNVPVQGEQPWRYMDFGQSRIRVHTQLKSST